MPKYRKKPVVIDAEVYRPGLEDGIAAVINPELCGGGEPIIAKAVHPSDRLDCYLRSDHVDRELVERKAADDPELVLMPFIRTLEGLMFVSEGDYIITGVKGERYPCKPDIFAATYEPAESESQAAEVVRGMERVCEAVNKRYSAGALKVQWRDLHEAMAALEAVGYPEGATK